MRAKTGMFYAGLAAALLLISGCSTPGPAAPPDTAVPTLTGATATSEPVSPLPTPAQESPLPTPAMETGPAAEPLPVSAWTPDGAITNGEYDRQADFGDIRLSWRYDATWLYLALEGDTDGWVAVGINPQRGMQGANYIFGYVKDGEASIWDAYGTAPSGPNHPPDEELGGTDDIEAYAGVEENGVTRFEVQVPLDSGDAYDHTLEPGMGYPIIVAIGGEDSYNAYHLRYDRGELILLP